MCLLLQNKLGKSSIGISWVILLQSLAPSRSHPPAKRSCLSLLELSNLVSKFVKSGQSQLVRNSTHHLELSPQWVRIGQLKRPLLFPIAPRDFPAGCRRGSVCTQQVRRPTCHHHFLGIEPTIHDCSLNSNLFKGVMTWSIIGVLSELCCPFLKGGNSAFITAMVSGLFPQTEYRSLE